MTAALRSLGPLARRAGAGGVRAPRRMAICISAISACGRDARCRSTRSSSTRRWRPIDLGYDLAFLLMDLDRRAGRAAANRVLNRYVARTGDSGLVAGLPAFLSLRAMVRAHVEARSRRPCVGGGLSGRGGGLSAARAARRGGGRRPAGHRKIDPGARPGARARPRARRARAAQRRNPQAPARRGAGGRAAGGGLCRSGQPARVPRPGRGGASGRRRRPGGDRGRDLPGPAASSRAGPGGGRRCPSSASGWKRRWRALEARLASRRGDASDATVAVLRASARGRRPPRRWHRIDATEARDALFAARQLLDEHLQAAPSNRSHTSRPHR